MDVDATFPSSSSDADLDFSFTSCASNTSVDRTTFASSSSARSSLTLSFNESKALSFSHHQKPHRKSDPHWSAIRAAAALSSDATLHLRHLKLLRHLGSGNLGRVYLCRLRDYEESASGAVDFALKVVDRDVVSSKKLARVQMESEVLSMVDHPFLPTLYAHLDVSHYTCLLIDYCPCGDLHSLLCRQQENRFGVDAVRFFASEVLVALEYLHAIGIIYRDLKPENVLIREDGHIMLSDFDLCFKADVAPVLERRSSSNPMLGPARRSKTPSSWCGCFSALLYGRRSHTTVYDAEEVTEFVAEPTTAYSKACVGTHEYLAPELVNGNGHGNGVDWWAFGVFIYELLFGITPFKGESKEATLRNIASCRPLRFPVSTERVDEEGFAEAKDLIERLLTKDPTRRLGCSRGATNIKQHPFFKEIDWPLIRMRKVPAEVRGLRRKASHVRKGGLGLSLSFNSREGDVGGRSLSFKGSFGNLVKWSSNLSRNSSGSCGNIKGRKWV